MSARIKIIENKSKLPRLAFVFLEGQTVHKTATEHPTGRQTNRELERRRKKAPCLSRFVVLS